MMNNKTVFKYFSIPQYQKEENYLSSMHEQGWRLTHISYPGLYHFEKCEPKQYSYRLDYNQEGLKNKDEYVQMFADCGWEYLFDFVGYSYFRKEGAAGEEREEIFADESSRLDMMNRVFMGRIIPLIVLFATIVIPQFFLNSVSFGSVSEFQVIMSYVFLAIALLYLIIFAATTIQFYQYEKKIRSDSSQIGFKYIGALALIILFAGGIGTFFWTMNRSIYEVTDRDSGYVIEAARLNSSVVKEFDLKTNDTVVMDLDIDRGSVHLSVAEPGKDPVFFGDFSGSDSHEFTVAEAGHYRIEVAGHKAEANVEVTIK